MPFKTNGKKKDEDLRKYFTNVEYLQDLFKSLVSEPHLEKRLLVIHGVGGVGKTSLLRMFRLYCQDNDVPAAYTSGDEVHSISELLTTWSEDFERNKTKFPNTLKKIERQRKIQTNINRRAIKEARRVGVAVDTVTDAAKTVAGDAIGSFLPGLGHVAGHVIKAAIGTSKEELHSWLSGFLKETDIKLLLDPSEILSESFIDDLNELISQKRIVLLLDTYERLSAINKWMAEFVQYLCYNKCNVVLVIAGRVIPKWEQHWQTWFSEAIIEELKPLDDETMRELLHRYYQFIRQDKQKLQQASESEIIECANGLPFGVVTAIALWAQNEKNNFNFHHTKPMVIAELVDLLLKGIPETMIPAIETAAVVRWFNKDILREVSQIDDCNKIYHELRRFPFTRPHSKEGLTFHDIIREIIQESLRIHDTKRYFDLHKRALNCFKALQTSDPTKDPEQLRLEQLYHHFYIDEKQGMLLFQKLGEELSLYRFIGQLQALLKDVSTYSLHLESSSRWWNYYNARLAHLEARLEDAEHAYNSIINDENVEPKLKAYALCDLGELLARYERIGLKNGIKKATTILEESLKIGELDPHLVKSYFSLGRVARYDGKWDKDQEYLNEAIRFFKDSEDNYGLVLVYAEMKQANGRRGLWEKFFEAHDMSLKLLSKIKLESPYLKATVFKMWLWAWALAGHISDCEKKAREALAITRKLRDNITTIRLLRDLGWCLGIQNRFSMAMQCFEESLGIAKRLGPIQESERGYTLGFWGIMLARCGEVEQAKKYLLESLQIKKKQCVKPGILESLVWLGVVSEVEKDWETALNYYQEGLEWECFGDNYFYCGCLTGLIRVYSAPGKYEVISNLFRDAEELALKYKYYDYLATLKLSKGHLIWGNDGFEGSSGYEFALENYQQAIIFALNYNRFMLDEVLWGGGITTPLQPIITNCLKRGDEGLRMLNELCDWWKTGVNNVGYSFQDSISKITKGIPLIDAEKLARQKEPGDGSTPKMILKHFEEAIKNFNSSQF